MNSWIFDISTYYFLEIDIDLRKKQLVLLRQLN